MRQPVRTRGVQPYGVRIRRLVVKELEVRGTVLVPESTDPMTEAYQAYWYGCDGAEFATVSERVRDFGDLTDEEQGVLTLNDGMIGFEVEEIPTDAADANVSDLISVSRAAAECGVSRQAMLRAARKQLGAVRLGPLWMIIKDERYYRYWREARDRQEHRHLSSGAMDG